MSARYQRAYLRGPQALLGHGGQALHAHIVVPAGRHFARLRTAACPATSSSLHCFAEPRPRISIPHPPSASSSRRALQLLPDRSDTVHVVGMTLCASPRRRSDRRISPTAQSPPLASVSPSHCISPVALRWPRCAAPLTPPTLANGSDIRHSGGDRRRTRRYKAPHRCGHIEPSPAPLDPMPFPLQAPSPARAR